MTQQLWEVFVRPTIPVFWQFRLMFAVDEVCQRLRIPMPEGFREI